MIPAFPASLPQTPRRGSWDGGPRDTRRSFQPEQGPPLMRRSTTAEFFVYEGVIFPNLKAADRTVWADFVREDLQGGALAFSWQDPDLQQVFLWKITPGDFLYKLNNRGADLRDLTVSLERRPGPPWWSGYCLAGDNRAPAVVADYVNGVFGVNGIRGTAAQVAAAAGTFDVYTTSAPGGVVTSELAHVVLAGDIPATAPGGVGLIRAFLP